MEIREIKSSEKEMLLHLYRYLHETDVALPDREAIGRTWRQVQDTNGHLIFGGFTGGHLVSSCVITIVPNFTRDCSPYALIENVITHPDNRRRGFGQAVVRHAIDYAKQKDCYKIMLLTGRKNEAIYRFYESIGFDRNEKQAFVIKIKTT
jgi:ribosomal protein S18 acetylase RimI-like enzyme